MTAAAVSWQEIASALTRRTTRTSQGAGHGRREISQETVRAIRRDSEEGVMTRAEIAAKHGVSRHYVYLVVECGLRDDEREQLRSR